MALLQSCIRCRSRRMKCDLRLPSCGACSQAELECCTTDTGLRENVPRSYIHSLQQQVERLEHQIQSRQHSDRRSSLISSQHDSLETAQVYDYVGPGTSVDVFDQICRLLQHHSPTIVRAHRTQISASASECIFQPLSILPDLRVDDFLTPSVQRGLVTHYIKSVGSEFSSILSEQQEQMFSQEADPLLTCSRAGTPLLRIVLLSTFAISAHLISRDFHAEYAYLARMCWSEVQRSMKTFPNDIHLLDETSLDHIRIMCLIAVNELIGPNRSRVSMDLLNASQLLLTMAPQTQQNDHMVSVSFAQLGLFLSQLEASLCLHFQRPSMQYETLRTLSSQPTTWLDTCMRISQLFQRSKKPTEAELTSIPEMPKFPASRLTTEIVSTYLELHPLFTADLSWLCAENVVCPCSSELLLHVSSAARIYIEHLYSKKSAVCIWMTLERVLKSGFVWIVWTIYQLRAGHDIDVADLTRPLTQCDHVLSVLVERWKPGLPYYESWDIIRQTTLSVIHDAINPR